MRARSIPILLTLALACASAGSSQTISIEFRTARLPAQDRPPSSEASGGSFWSCVEEQAFDRLRYRYPAGQEVPVEASRTRRLELDTTPVRVVLQEVHSAAKEGASAIGASLVLADVEQIGRANLFRHENRGCRVLVLVEGAVVGLEGQGNAWGAAVPGGWFRSFAEAEEIYRGHTTVRQYSSGPDPEAKAFWDADRHRILWAFHCDEEVREDIRRTTPEAYEGFTERPELFEAIDCGEVPPLLRHWRPAQPDAD